MNTINSVYYGWGFLIACGAGSYYFAKRSINADRYERQAAENERRLRHNRQLAMATHQKLAGTGTSSGSGSEGKKEGSAEDRGPAFESKEPFRSKKGDRFS